MTCKKKKGTSGCMFLLVCFCCLVYFSGQGCPPLPGPTPTPGTGLRATAAWPAANTWGWEPTSAELMSGDPGGRV